MRLKNRHFQGDRIENMHLEFLAAKVGHLPLTGFTIFGKLFMIFGK